MTVTADGRSILLRTVTEKQWQAQIVAWAKRAGWRSYHVWNAMHSTSGFPDMVLVRPPHIIYAELKTERGKVTADQEAWIDALRRCGQQVYVWRPSDEDSVRKVLA